MINVQEISQDLFRWTGKAYHRLAGAGILDEDSKVELLNGQILVMSPAGNQHAACIDRLDELLRDTFGKTVNIRIQSPIFLGPFTEPEPDVAILKRKENFYADGRPRPGDILLL